MITLQAIQLDEVLNSDRIRYNTNNIYTERPTDYFDKLASCNTNNWVYKFHKEEDIKVLVIPKKHLYWIAKAHEEGKLTGRFPSFYRDELEDLLSDLNNTKIFNGTSYFDRSENVSLKTGIHKAGPYKDLRCIIESVVTSRYGHSPIEDIKKDLVLYLFPWITLDTFLEFRAFAYEGKITAISQQFIYNVNPYDSETLYRCANIIVEFYKERINGELPADATFDIAILKDPDTRNLVPYFIEPNCFGAEYAAGSALFGWVQDHDILLSDGQNVIVRYTVV